LPIVLPVLRENVSLYFQCSESGGVIRQVFRSPASGCSKSGLLRQSARPWWPWAVCFSRVKTAFDVISNSTFRPPIQLRTRRVAETGAFFSRMGKGAASFICRRAPLHHAACSQVVRGGAYGSDSGLGEWDIDRDCGAGGGAVMGVAVVVEAVPCAAEARRGGVGGSPEALLLLYCYRWRASSAASSAS
jgi:hypothetical protein